MSNLVLVGTLPNPIGGVSSFCYRLCEKDQGSVIDELIDPYFDAEKVTLKSRITVTSKKGCYSNKWVWLFRALIKKNRDVIHFNFSSSRALLFLAILPKRRNKWLLTLHNGNLKLPSQWVLRRISRYSLGKMDIIFSLCEKHNQYYKKNHVSCSKVRKTSSYIYQAIEPQHLDSELLSKWRKCSRGYKRRYIASGYPVKIYNHLETLKIFKGRPECFLTMCLYGPDAEGLLKELLKYNQEPNIYIYTDMNQTTFNQILSESDVYLRPNEVDSFGIVVADAINMGLTVIASDACERYSGALVFNGMDQYQAFIDQAMQQDCGSGDRANFSDSYADYKTTYIVQKS